MCVKPGIRVPRPTASSYRGAREACGHPTLPPPLCLGGYPTLPPPPLAAGNTVRLRDGVPGHADVLGDGRYGRGRRGGGRAAARLVGGVGGAAGGHSDGDHVT
jgi:hypothetical protein